MNTYNIPMLSSTTFLSNDFFVRRLDFRNPKRPDIIKDNITKWSLYNTLIGSSVYDEEKKSCFLYVNKKSIKEMQGSKKLLTRALDDLSYLKQNNFIKYDDDDLDSDKCLIEIPENRDFWAIRI